VQSGLLELNELVKVFIVLCQILWLITVTLILYIYQINFYSLVIRAIYLLSISKSPLSIFTCNSAALYALYRINGKYFFFISLTFQII